MKKLLFGLLLFVSPLVAMDKEQRGDRPGALDAVTPGLAVANWMGLMAEQRNVDFSGIDGVVAMLIAKNWEAFQRTTKNDCVINEQLLEKMAQDSKPLIADMVQKKVTRYMPRSSDSERAQLVKNLLNADGNEVQLAVKRQLERVIKTLSMAHKMHGAEQAGKSESTD